MRRSFAENGTISGELLVEAIRKLLKAFAKMSRFLLIGRVMGIGEKLLDILVITLIIKVGIFVEFLIVVPLYSCYCTGIIVAYDYFLGKGYDFVGLEYLRNMQKGKVAKNKLFKRFLRSVMRRRYSIFWFGSVAQFNPDGVTLLLRRDRTSTLRNFLGITLPSTVLSIAFWTTVFKLGIMGVAHFKSFVQ
jgi:hypothetical protein